MPIPTPEQDLVHEPREDPRWRESYYFSFFDEALGIGGFSSIGKRAARGHSGSINVLWGPGIPTLVASEYDSFAAHVDQHSVAGLTYESSQPFGPWRIAFTGQLNDGGVGIECSHDALGPVGHAPADSVEVSFDLSFAPDRPAYIYEERDEWHDLFDGHVDEVGAVTGELTVAGQKYEINGRGGKDHSWGVRDWFKPVGWRWMDVVGSGGTEIVTWRADFGDKWAGDGALYGESGTEKITGFKEWIQTSERPRNPMPVAYELEASSATQQLGLEAQVVRIVPIFFDREDDGVRLTSWNDRALMRCTRSDGSRAWANVEFEKLLREPSG